MSYTATCNPTSVASNGIVRIKATFCNTLSQAITLVPVPRDGGYDYSASYWEFHWNYYLIRYIPNSFETDCNRGGDNNIVSQTFPGFEHEQVVYYTNNEVPIQPGECITVEFELQIIYPLAATLSIVSSVTYLIPGIGYGRQYATIRLPVGPGTNPIGPTGPSYCDVTGPTGPITGPTGDIIFYVGYSTISACMGATVSVIGNLYNQSPSNSVRPLSFLFNDSTYFTAIDGTFKINGISIASVYFPSLSRYQINVPNPYFPDNLLHNNQSMTISYVGRISNSAPLGTSIDVGGIANYIIQLEDAYTGVTGFLYNPLNIYNSKPLIVNCQAVCPSCPIGPVGPQGMVGTVGQKGIVGSQGYQGIGGVGPQGIIGSGGQQGIAGSTGQQGTGNIGQQGTEGNIGLQGITGSIGLEGIIGSIGLQGMLGSTGQQGIAGSVAQQGMLGSTGQQGIIGSMGQQGIEGSTGQQGTGSVGQPGIVGSTGLQGIVGSTGYQGMGGIGAQGIVGSTGVQGTGSMGQPGIAGSTGLQGVVGYTGSQGNVGIGQPGMMGSSGLQGIVGSTGQQGTGSVGQPGIAGGTGLQGMAGNMGLQGIVGSTGQQGTGSTGQQGIVGGTGLQGMAGNMGLQGIIGSIGQLGIIGDTGLQGIVGSTGQQETGSIGQPGIVGGAGLQGIVGNTGLQGIVGNTGFQGIVGTVGLQGITGNTGLQGIVGSIGPQSDLGNTGQQGITGKTGLQGIIGNTGLTGDICISLGITGPQGAVGPIGTTGSSSILDISFDTLTYFINSQEMINPINRVIINNLDYIELSKVALYNISYNLLFEVNIGYNYIDIGILLNNEEISGYTQRFSQCSDFIRKFNFNGNLNINSLNNINYISFYIKNTNNATNIHLLTGNIIIASSVL